MLLRKILITGGAGYVGAVLVPKLVKKGYEVTVVDWFIYGDVFKDIRNSKHLKQVKGDIRDRKLLERELKGMDAVIHLACISNDPSFELNPLLGKSVNYDATVSLIDLSKKAKVKRFVYASSSSVYGVKEEDQVTEDLKLEPLTDYSKYKVLCEDYLISQQSDDFTVLILRPSTVCGFSPRLRLDLTVNILTIQALVNKKMTVFGGKQKRPNIHIKDMVDLYTKTLAYPKKRIAGKIYNAGFDNYTVLDIAQKIKKTLGDRNIEIKILPSNDNRSYKVSSDKIKKELGFAAKHSVEEAVMDLKKAYDRGLIPEALTLPRYRNIKMMQMLKIE